MRECRAPGKCLYLAFDAPLPCDDPSQQACECACGQLRHFMSPHDYEQALTVNARKDAAKVKSK